ncbi:MAG: branched-chain amino acid transport system II carrier protein, partial [Sutterella wadsworthensis]
MKARSRAPSWHEAAVAQAALLVFFFLLATIALNPSSRSASGKILSPTAHAHRGALHAPPSLRHAHGESGAVRPYDAAPFVRGFIEGYQTMDTLAALSFEASYHRSRTLRALGVHRRTRASSARPIFCRASSRASCSSRSMPRSPSAPKRAVRALRAKTAP